VQGLDRFGKDLLAARNPFTAGGGARRPVPLSVLFSGAGSPAPPDSPASPPPPPPPPPGCAPDGRSSAPQADRHSCSACSAWCDIKIQSSL